MPFYRRTYFKLKIRIESNSYLNNTIYWKRQSLRQLGKIKYSWIIYNYSIFNKNIFFLFEIINTFIFFNYNKFLLKILSTCFLTLLWNNFFVHKILLKWVRKRSGFLFHWFLLEIVKIVSSHFFHLSINSLNVLMFLKLWEIFIKYLVFFRKFEKHDLSELFFHF